MNTITERRISRLAIASFTLSLLALTFLLFVAFFPSRPEWLFSVLTAIESLTFVGFATGLIALFTISRSQGRCLGYAWAVAGIMIPVLAVILFRVLFPLRCEIPPKGPHEICASRLRSLSHAMAMYAQDWDGRFPNSKNWNASLLPYVTGGDIFACPADRSHSRLPSYAMNGTLSGLRLRDVSEKSVAFFDSVPGRNQSGTWTLLPSLPRHNGAHNFVFLDFHVKRMSTTEARDLLPSSR